MSAIQTHDMKKYFAILLLFTTGVVAYAVFFTKFTSWDDLVEQSPDIIIARCTGTVGTFKPEGATPQKTTVITDNIVPSDIEVVSVLKGNTKPGLSHIRSGYWPHQNELFLVFANYRSDQYYSGYAAIEDYRVIPLSRDFRTNELVGKTLNEQIQLILNGRLKDLNDELTRNNEEKLRLEQGFKHK
jgi:hypothetical protein